MGLALAGTHHVLVGVFVCGQLRVIFGVHALLKWMSIVLGVDAHLYD